MRIEQESTNNFLNALGYGVFQGRAVCRLSSILRFVTVVDFDMAIGRYLMLGGNAMYVLEKKVANLILHGEANSLLLVVPIEVDDRKFVAGPIFGDGVIFHEDITEVMGMAFANIFNTQVIYDETESDGAPFVAPEVRSGERFIIAVSMGAWKYS